MAMTERSRHKLFETFSGLVDDEQAVEEMLSYFPARDVEEPVTKEFLRAELQTEVGAVRIEVGELRAEMHKEFGAVRSEVGELRAEMGTEFGAVRAEMRTEFGAVRAEMGELRAEMHAGLGEVRAEMGELRAETKAEIGSLRAEMHQMMRTTQTWFVGTGISLAGLILAVARFG